MSGGQPREETGRALRALGGVGLRRAGVLDRLFLLNVALPMSDWLPETLLMGKY